MSYNPALGLAILAATSKPPTATHDDMTLIAAELLRLTEVVAEARAVPTTEPTFANYTPGTWQEVKTREELEAFFLSRLPAIREAAHEHGYAIGLHGSLRRDMDLIAVPWRDGASDKDKLAHAIAMAAVGITRNGGYQWEQKPAGRVAASLPCCWTPWHGEAGSGHIDLSVMPSIEPKTQAQAQEPAKSAAVAGVEQELPDELEMAVKLKMSVEVYDGLSVATTIVGGSEIVHHLAPVDPLTATRRAIRLAAQKAIAAKGETT